MQATTDDVYGWLDDLAQKCEQGTDGRFSAELSDQISALVVEACEGRNGPTLDSILRFLGMGHGLHAAAARATANGAHNWAQELHGMAQLFLGYAASHVNAFAVDLAAGMEIGAAEVEAEEATKH